MRNKFKTPFFDTNLYRMLEKDGIEIDALAFSNGKTNKCYVIEVKSRYSKKVLSQLDNIITKMDIFYPEHRTKKKYGLIAVPHLKPSQLQEILSNGFYPATMKGDMLEIEAPINFKPKEF